jgi:alkylation response protein AidB-like acyl-CoA dehydrogenase
LAPVAQQVDRENKIPEEILEAVAEQELFGIPFAEEYGGAGAVMMAMCWPWNRLPGYVREWP